MLELSLIAPCLNEQENVRILAERFLSAAESHSLQVEVVFVDDGSTDFTWERLEELQQEHPGKIELVRHSSNRGIPQGWISGVEASAGRLVCLIDSDLQNPPESVFDLYSAFQNDAPDFVRGVRCPVRQQPRVRVLMSRTLNIVLNFVFGMASADNKSGFLLGRREAMLDIVRHKGHYTHFQTFIGVAAHSKGYRTIEIDTPFEDRRNGISFLSGNSLRVVRQVFGDIPEAQWEYGSNFRLWRRT